MKQQTTRPDLYQKVTNRIVQLLETGTTPWHKPWANPQFGFPMNFISKRPYSGINAMLLACTDHAIPYYMTFLQAKQNGGKIKKGTKAEQVYFYQSLHKDANGKTISESKYQKLKIGGVKGIKKIFYLKYYNVFNIENIEGIDYEIPTPTAKPTLHLIDRCEAVINQMAETPDIKHRYSHKAYYTPIGDFINVPNINQFAQAEEYYSTLFHELGHWTGHRNRLNRSELNDSNSFGDSNYSKEELTAEMTAAFLCVHTQIDISEVTKNSAAYIQGWISKLKADKKIIFQAASQAQAATNYILNKSNHSQEQKTAG